MCVAYLGWRKMTEVTGRSLWGLRLVEDLEVILGVRDFNHFFFFFDGWLGRGCLVLGHVLGEWFHLLYTFWSKVWVEKIRNNDVNQVQTTVFQLDHVLGHLEAK